MKRSSEITTLVFTCDFFFITFCTYGIEKKNGKVKKQEINQIMKNIKIKKKR